MSYTTPPLGGAPAMPVSPTQTPQGVPLQGGIPTAAVPPVMQQPQQPLPSMPQQGVVPVQGQPVMPVSQPPPAQTGVQMEQPMVVQASMQAPPAPAATTVAATPHGEDIPAMMPPVTGAEAPSTIQPTQVAPEQMYPDARSPQVIAQAPEVPVDLEIVADEIMGSQRVVTVRGPSVERTTGNDARQMAYNQRVQGGWVTAGIEYLDMYPVDENGVMVTDRLYNGPMKYHSRWRLTVTG